MELKPIVLSHPHIPQPLHGLNPRSIMGQQQWDIIRQKVYASTNYHCIACGIHKTKARNHHWLEAHEFYNINHQTGVCIIEDIIPLCHFCHNFIHSGRLTMIMGKDKSVNEIKAILEHGFKILADNNLQCFPYTLLFGQGLEVNTYGVTAYTIKENTELQWTDYKLIYNDKTYDSPFKSREEWLAYYKHK